MRGVFFGRLTPSYDAERRLFRWGQHILKRFRQPSVNQEAILAAAEELGWPELFDDPLPGKAGVNAKRRLHDTVKDLNRRQIQPRIHFLCNNDGEGVGWAARPWAGHIERT